MGYLDKNINMTLVALVVGIVIIMLGITVFFQLGLKSRTSDLDVTAGNLSQCTTQLANYQERLSQAQSQVASTSEDIRRYDQLYESKLAEIDEKEGELSSANRRIQNLELIKAGLENENTDLKSQRTQLQQDIDQLNARINDLRDDIDFLSDELDACEAGG